MQHQYEIIRYNVHMNESRQQEAVIPTDYLITVRSDKNLICVGCFNSIIEKMKIRERHILLRRKINKITHSHNICKKIRYCIQDRPAKTK